MNTSVNSQQPILQPEFHQNHRIIHSYIPVLHNPSNFPFITLAAVVECSDNSQI